MFNFCVFGTLVPKNLYVDSKIRVEVGEAHSILGLVQCGLLAKYLVVQHRKDL